MVLSKHPRRHECRLIAKVFSVVERDKLSPKKLSHKSPRFLPNSFRIPSRIHRNHEQQLDRSLRPQFVSQAGSRVKTVWGLQMETGCILRVRIGPQGSQGHNKIKLVNRVPTPAKLLPSSVRLTDSEEFP